MKGFVFNYSQTEVVEVEFNESFIQSQSIDDLQLLEIVNAQMQRYEACAIVRDSINRRRENMLKLTKALANELVSIEQLRLVMS